jgi:L-rhamnose mutarotase
VTGFRTRLLPGSEEAYATLHARVPPVVELKLRSAGILGWTIWADGSTLFHSIETRGAYDAAVAALAAIGPVDPAWDAAIGLLVDPDEDAAALLQRVWTMDADGQH